MYYSWVWLLMFQCRASLFCSGKRNGAEENLHQVDQFASREGKLWSSSWRLLPATLTSAEGCILCQRCRNSSVPEDGRGGVFYLSKFLSHLFAVQTASRKWTPPSYIIHVLEELSTCAIKHASREERKWALWWMLSLALSFTHSHTAVGGWCFFVLLFT